MVRISSIVVVCYFPFFLWEIEYYWIERWIDKVLFKEKEENWKETRDFWDKYDLVIVFTILGFFQILWIALDISSALKNGEEWRTWKVLLISSFVVTAGIFYYFRKEIFACLMYQKNTKSKKKLVVGNLCINIGKEKQDAPTKQALNEYHRNVIVDRYLNKRRYQEKNDQKLWKDYLKINEKK